MAEKPVKLRPFGSCPICGRPAVEAVRPFCSAQCRRVDLGRWLTEGYAIQTDGELGEAPPLPEDDG